MATPKTTTRKRATGTTTSKRSTARASSAKRAAASRSNARDDDSLVARTGRTIKERPYTSAAIATGAVTIAAAAAGATAFFMSRRDKSFREASSELGEKVMGGLADATESVRDGIASATGAVKDLGQRGAGYFKSNGGETGDQRTQQQIAEEALTLKQTGESKSPVDALSANEIKTGAVAY